MAELPKYICFRITTKGLKIEVDRVEPDEVAEDLKPVVRGRWLTTDAFPHRVYCSICYKTYIPNDRWQIWVDGDLPRDFCPNCGSYNGGDAE